MSGRFLSVDPHTDSYPDLTPFNYVGNNPLRFIDPTGMDSTDSHNNDNNEEADDDYVTINGHKYHKNIAIRLLQQGFFTISDFTVQSAGASGDFIGQYNTMREENIIGNDHYNHAMANSKATLRGEWGRRTAILLSHTREGLDFLKGDSWGNIKEDQIANRYGRSIPNSVSPSDHNAIFDVRRGGARATINPNPSNNVTIIDLIKFSFKLSFTHF